MLEPRPPPCASNWTNCASSRCWQTVPRQSIGTDLPLAGVVDRLSGPLRRRAWLDRIEINGSEIRIMGLTGNATELIAHLGAPARLAKRHRGQRP
ncbi:MAG: hypothetical protein R3E55_08365 [Burkholderiaceae bacterium]